MQLFALDLAHIAFVPILSVCAPLIDNFLSALHQKHRTNRNKAYNTHQCTAQEHTALAAEGVVVKNLTSQWIPNDRSDAWLKIKPDYLRKHDLDAVVVGSFYSSGKRGQDAASLTQFLLALPDRGPGDSGPVQWLTFAKCVGKLWDLLLCICVYVYV